MADKNFRSLPEMFVHRVKETPDKPAYQFPKGDDWAWLTWKEAGDRVRAIACGLRSLGVENEQRVAILSSTRIEWILADLGILSAGAAASTVYPSNTPEECAYILSDSDSRFIFAEDDDQVAKLASVREQLPSIVKVFVIDGSAGHDGWVITLDDLEELGRKHDAANPDLFDKTVDSLKPDDLATLIYTSGTTGKPKGVRLAHDCWVFEGQAIADLNILSIDEDHQYLWLPLSHSFGKVLEAAQIAVGFPTTVDGRIPKLVENLAIVRPTFMAAAPRIFEKVFNKVVTGAQAAGGMKYKIFRWAIKTGRQVSALRQRGEEPSGWLGFKVGLAEKMVFSKLQALFGGRVKFFISGAAPLSRDIAEFFHAAGVLILEGYGLTETSAASFVNRPDTFKFGTVGLPVGTTEVKIADDGEILIRGRGVMSGYHNMADTTAEVLTKEGWFHTGDIGELDEIGRLKITDRKKDLIKTSGGKYVAPQLLEGRLKALCPYISQVIVHGDKRNYCTALVTIEEESITKWAEDNGVAGGYKELTGDSKVREMVQQGIDQLNSALASYETIKKFAILPEDLTVETGDLTPSLKVKRKVVEKKFASVLDDFYKDAMAV